MKTRLTLCTGMLVLAALVGLQHVGSITPTATADPLEIVLIAGVLPSAMDKGPTPEYVGSNKCKKCHLPQHKSWKKTKHAGALKTLKPAAAAGTKSKHGLSPDKDYTEDAMCLACHTVGFGTATGYAIPSPDDKKAQRRAKRLAGVGCEACHGPGSVYIELHAEIMKSKRTYKTEEMYAAGMRNMDDSVCLTCHNQSSPTVDVDSPIDFKKSLVHGVHGHTPLKQRTD